MLPIRYDERIKALEEELDRLSLRFTDLHPDVVESRALLESLEKSRQKEIDAFLNADESNNTQPLTELNREIKLEASRLESQIASLRVKDSDLQRKILCIE